MSEKYILEIKKKKDYSKIKIIIQPFDFISNDLNFNLTLTKDDLFLEDGDKLLFLIIFGHPQPILGFPVFKKYQFIFNQDTNIIGLYNKIEGNPSSPISLPPSHFGQEKKGDSYRIIIIILILAIFLLCALALINYFRDNKKKTILNEKYQIAGIQLMDYEKIEK